MHFCGVAWDIADSRGQCGDFHEDQLFGGYFSRYYRTLRVDGYLWNGVLGEEGAHCCHVNRFREFSWVPHLQAVRIERDPAGPEVKVEYHPVELPKTDSVIEE